MNLLEQTLRLTRTVSFSLVSLAGAASCGRQCSSRPSQNNPTPTTLSRSCQARAAAKKRAVIHASQGYERLTWASSRVLTSCRSAYTQPCRPALRHWSYLIV